MDIHQILNEIFPLAVSSQQKLETCVEEIFLPKGSLILEADKVESYLYFIKKGLARAFAHREDNEVTFWFGKEGDVLISISSLMKNEKGYENIELLEDSELYRLDTNKLRKLFDEDIHIVNWGRRLAERALITTENRLIDLQILSATSRYQKLINEAPDFLQRVQLGYIASYLGITQVSLSRIRANTKF